jgi:chloramphenicol-sensitive protein RarD
VLAAEPSLKLPLPHASASVRIGLVFAVAAYTIWGVFPLFWRLLAAVPALEVVCHRIVWSTVFLAIVIPLLRWRTNAVGIELAGHPEKGLFVAPASTLDSGANQQRRLWTISFLAAVVISVNWLSFVWAVNNDRVLDSSLGYYIAPLVNVALGVLVLRERLSRWQWLAIVIACAGVMTMSIASGKIPWVSLAMAGSFGIYGLLKKKAPMPALTGLLMENMVLSGPALAYLLAISAAGKSATASLGWQIDVLLIIGGIVTVPPLMLFALAVRRVTLSTIGVLQYIGPTLQFLLGVLVMGEAFGHDRLIGFSLVWTGSLIYVAGAHHAHRQSRHLLAV